MHAVGTPLAAQTAHAGGAFLIGSGGPCLWRCEGDLDAVRFTFGVGFRELDRLIGGDLSVGGVFYPPKLPQRSEFAFVAKNFKR